MSEFRARISRVRMKSGGADVRVIHRPQDANGESWPGKLIEAAKHIAGMTTDKSSLAGYFIIGMFSDGTTSTGFRYDPTQSPIPRSLMPAWIEEIVRRDIITAQEAADMVNEANGF